MSNPHRFFAVDLSESRQCQSALTAVRELQEFRVDFTAAGHLTFNARSGKHDDLVLALAIAVWRAYGGGGPGQVYFEAMRTRLEGSGAAPRYFVGVDLGQARDPTAIAVVRRVGTSEPVEAVMPKPEIQIARGSLEWQRQQERLQEGAEKLRPAT